MEGPFLWYLNRGSGVVTLVFFTLTVVLGVLSIGGTPARGVPRFVTQSLHRNVSMLAFVMLVAHVVSAVVDEYVDIRWWQVFVPYGATYEPLWLGLGAVALDLILVIVVSSLLKHRVGRRIQPRTWRLLHLLAWPMWVLAFAHGVGMGTDLRDGWWLVTVACGVAVVAALGWRLLRLLAPPAAPTPTPTTPSTPQVPELRVLR